MPSVHGPHTLPLLVDGTCTDHAPLPACIHSLSHCAVLNCRLFSACCAATVNACMRDTNGPRHAPTWSTAGERVHLREGLPYHWIHRIGIGRIILATTVLVLPSCIATAFHTCSSFIFCYHELLCSFSLSSTRSSHWWILQKKRFCQNESVSVGCGLVVFLSTNYTHNYNH